MDNNKLDEIMEKYLSTTVNGKEADLKKVDFDKFEKKRNYVRTKAFACLASILIVAIAVVLIVLPIVFRDTGKRGEDLFFANDSELLYIYSADKEQVFGNFDNVIIPTLEHEDSLYSEIRLKETNDIIGLTVGYGLYDDIYDDIDIYILKNRYILLILEKHLALEKQFEWRGIKVKYEIVENNMQYNCKIYFEDNGYRYFINTVFYEPIDIQFILETIYG